MQLDCDMRSVHLGRNSHRQQKDWRLC
jgi:hypothetical protein